jgi:cytochrome P450
MLFVGSYYIIPLQNVIPLAALRQPELKLESLISEVQNFRTLIHLYFTYLLFVLVFTETLPFLDRISYNDYELPAPTGNGIITLPADTGVYIPVIALHYDKTYYPEPQKFDPDRFTEENKHSRPNYTCLPFGEGPRMCIGKERYFSARRKNLSFCH